MLDLSSPYATLHSAREAFDRVIAGLVNYVGVANGFHKRWVFITTF